mgnify:CR=1 FL=1
MKCLVCNSAINGQYYQDYWGNKVCRSHIDNNEVTFCASCGSFVPVCDSTGDGRSLCKSCMASVISNAEQVNKLKRYVLRQLMDIGVLFNDKFLDSVDIDIVSPQKMAEIRKQPINFQNKGLTQTQSRNTIGGRLFGCKDKHEHHIYMLSYLPKIEFAATLAHEVLHIWQIENGIQLPPLKCEGLCNIGSYLIYENMSAQKAPYYRKSLMESPDPIYGDGFRLVYSIYEQCGAEELFEIAKNNKL